MTTQEKLEAFAPYYPHELKVITYIHNIYTVSFDIDVDVEKCVSPQDVVKFNLKPILRPLSDLTKPCLEGGKVPIVELAKECFKACYGFDFKNDKFDVHCNTSSSNYSTIFRDEKDYVFAINNRDWRFNVEFKTRNMVFDLNVNKIIKQLYKWHFWLGDQSEFGKSIIDINTINNETR